MKNAIRYILFACPIWIFACTPPAPPSPEERQRQFVHCFREEMKPTDEQMKTLESRILVANEATRKVAEELRKVTDDLETGLESATADSELLARFHRVGELKAQLSEDHFRKMLTLRSILTPEQRAKFLTCKRKMGPAALPHE